MIVSKTRHYMQNETKNLGSKTDICFRWLVYLRNSFFLYTVTFCIGLFEKLFLSTKVVIKKPKAYFAIQVFKSG